ncbi:sugar ABC transporter permease [Actinomyces sp. B33]|uniref:carbohydrate ABC transporter permease n=1 Tax=Actinomyces sp. B33 TaxID=2942131 RepID=UPI002341ACCE|nr:sugar ABC transporter permease [Actinomyces sp. B33]MDC4232446.1 sugar ABC transporter permease [Actinomyces sp. B33]
MTTATGEKTRSRAGGPRPAQSHPLVFLVPAGLMLAAFFLLPTVMNFAYAFTDWSAFKKSIEFNGLDNLRTLLSSGALVADIRITLVYALLVAVFQNLFGLALAVLFEEDTPLNRLGRTLFFIPVLMSALAAGYIWQAILTTHGALNQIASWFSGHEIRIEWLGSPSWTLVILAVVHAWKWMGFSMLTYLAGLKTIDHEILEAAQVDGARPTAVFWRIKFPLLAPALTFNVATALLGSMNSFDIVQSLTNGGPGGSTEILNLFIWRTFGKGLYSQSTTMSLVLFLLVSLMAVPLITALRRRESTIL